MYQYFPYYLRPKAAYESGPCHAPRPHSPRSYIHNQFVTNTLLPIYFLLPLNAFHTAKQGIKTYPLVNITYANTYPFAKSPPLASIPVPFNLWLPSGLGVIVKSALCFIITMSSRY